MKKKNVIINNNGINIKLDLFNSTGTWSVTRHSVLKLKNIFCEPEVRRIISYVHCNDF